MQTSESGRLRWRPIEPFGVGLQCDLSKPLDAADASLFRALFYENSLLVARSQELDMEQQIAVLEYIGPVLRSTDTIGYVSTDNSVGVLGDKELGFHSDLAWASHPQRAGSLYAVELENEQSYTDFANSAFAYAALPENIKSEIANATALQVIELDAHYAPGARPVIGGAADLRRPHAYHPLVMVHPVTNKLILYMSESATVAVEGVPPDRMMPLGKILLDHLYRPENIYRHHWHKGDLVIWDNLALQHARGDVSDVGVRTLQRVAVSDKSLAEMDPRFDEAKNPKIRNYLTNVNEVDPEDVYLSNQAID